MVLCKFFIIQLNYAVLKDIRKNREIAWLAAQQQYMKDFPEVNFPGMAPFAGNVPMAGFPEAYLQRRAQAIYEKYGAYIMVVDRNGRIMDNKDTALADDPAFAAMIRVNILASPARYGLPVSSNL